MWSYVKHLEHWIKAGLFQWKPYYHPSFLTRDNLRSVQCLHVLITYHSTTFKLLKTVQLVTFPSKYSSHVVALSLALAKSFTIKRAPNILIIAICIFCWQPHRLTASSLFDVMQPRVFPCPIKTSHEVSIRTGCPLVGAIRQKNEIKNRKRRRKLGKN